MDDFLNARDQIPQPGPPRIDDALASLLKEESSDVVRELLATATEPLLSPESSRDQPPPPTLPSRHRFGLALRRIRERHGLSQNELARRAGLTSGYLSKLENARASLPTRQALEQLSRALGVPPEYLLGSAGLVDDELLHYIENNHLIVEFLTEAMNAAIPRRSWAVLRSVLQDEIRANIRALSE